MSSSQKMFKVHAERSRFALACIVLCAALANSTWAQSQNEGAQSSPQNPANPGSLPSGSIVFMIRSAFGLTPAMVQVLQSRSADTSSMSVQSSGIVWSEALTRTVPTSVPVDVRLTGKNIVAQVQIIPLERLNEAVNLVVQGQVWVQMSDGSVSFKSTLQTLSVAFGSRFYFYPLGTSEKSGAPIAVEVRLDKPARK